MQNSASMAFGDAHGVWSRDRLRSSYVCVTRSVNGISADALAAIAGYIIARSSSRKTVFTSGIGVAFLATVLFCFGKQPWVLVLARAVQGLAGPLVYVSALVMILDSVDGEGVGAWCGHVLHESEGLLLTNETGLA